MTIFTIGHSNKSKFELARRLNKNKIDLLVDVRSIPFSSYNPQFNKPHIQPFITKNDIEYIWKGRNLGGKEGKEGNINYDANIKWILKTAKTKNLCIMCSEGNYKACHRHFMLEPDLIKASPQTIVFHHISWGDNDCIYSGKKNLFGKKIKSLIQEPLFQTSENGVTESTPVFQIGG